ncbi:MAG: acyltransferase family protein, partial [Prevotellaceae bacterium]|nr:acyltransferase family protein [Prevotellaceae bacterium]
MRRYDIDYLRVIVFGLLIFYHVGMFFIPWGFHIKNPVIYDKPTFPMIFLNQWRLPLLFIISGIGTYYALSKRTGIRFIGERLKRLLIPLIIGILFIVPPQVYFERLNNGQFGGSYFEFWPAHAFSGVYPEGNFSWHHLWFLPYLLLFSLMLTPIFLYLRRNSQNGFMRFMSKTVAGKFGLYVFILPLFVWELYLKPHFPSTHALVGDWYNLAHYATLFFSGFLLVSLKDAFWNTVKKHRRLYL